MVGAGPGDPGLLTVKGKKYLEDAEVVVYDRLVGPEVMDWAPSAELIYVGKEKDHHPIPQHEINEVLAQQAKLGKRVVRLKGGDPFLFGRGGEEIEHLRQNGIPFEVVPGVTSAMAALSYAGIPATHRSAASSIHIITGHAQKGGRLNIDFEALSRCNGTLVFLMAVTGLETITKGLLNAGMPGDTPAAIVENGTLPQQRKLVATLATIAPAARESNIESPAILAVGEVCALSEKLDWFSKLPLFGKTVVVTRPKQRAGTLCEKLQALGARVIPLPCIETADIEAPAVAVALHSLSRYGWLALTSPQGVQSLFRVMQAEGLDSRALAGVKIAAVGASTAEELALHGIRADYTPLHYDAVHLAGGLVGQIEEGQRVLLLRAELGTPELPEMLKAKQIPFDDIPLYRTLLLQEESTEAACLLRAGGADYVTFTSASTVAGFAACIPNAQAYAFTAVCIGASSEKAAKEKGYKTKTAHNATIDALIEAMLEEEKP